MGSIHSLRRAAIHVASRPVSVNLPAAGIGILLAVDPIPDMFRTASNVTGWLCAGTMLNRGAAATPKESVAQSAAIVN